MVGLQGCQEHNFSPSYDVCLLFLKMGGGLSAGHFWRTGVNVATKTGGRKMIIRIHLCNPHVQCAVFFLILDDGSGGGALVVGVGSERTCESLKIGKVRSISLGSSTTNR